MLVHCKERMKLWKCTLVTWKNRPLGGVPESLKNMNEIIGKQMRHIFRRFFVQFAQTFVLNAFSAYDHFTRHTDNDNTLDDNKIWMMTMTMWYLNFRESSTRVFAYVLHSEKRVESANARAWTEFCSSNCKLTMISENKQIFKFLNYIVFHLTLKPNTCCFPAFSLLIIGLNLKIDPSSPANLLWVESSI